MPGDAHVCIVNASYSRLVDAWDVSSNHVVFVIDRSSDPQLVPGFQVFFCAYGIVPVICLLFSSF